VKTVNTIGKRGGGGKRREEKNTKCFADDEGMESPATKGFWTNAFKSKQKNVKKHDSLKPTRGRGESAVGGTEYYALPEEKRKEARPR